MCHPPSSIWSDERMRRGWQKEKITRGDIGQMEYFTCPEKRFAWKKNIAVRDYGLHKSTGMKDKNEGTNGIPRINTVVAK